LLNIPLFPLQTVLFPGGVLPLRIFEPRYLALVKRCHSTNMPFGIVSLAQGSEAWNPNTAAERFHPFGVLAKITRLQTVQPGLLLLECRGSQRFRIDSQCQQHLGLWNANVSLVAEDKPTSLPPDLQHCARSLEQLANSLRAQNPDSSWLPLQASYQLDDCSWVANRWCELLPLPVAEKHNLMALDSPLLRLELIADILAQTHFSDPPAH
jgi:Lon protease-like protein